MVQYYSKEGTKLRLVYPVVLPSGAIVCTDDPEIFAAAGAYPLLVADPGEAAEGYHYDISDWQLVGGRWEPVWTLVQSEQTT